MTPNLYRYQVQVAVVDINVPPLYIKETDLSRTNKQILHTFTHRLEDAMHHYTEQ